MSQTTNPTTTAIRRVTFAVDWEAQASTWWDAAVAAPECPDELYPLIHQVRGRKLLDHVRVPADRVEDCLAWCRSLPGWDDGPWYARTALLIG